MVARLQIYSASPPLLLNVKLPNLLHRQTLSMKGSALKWERGPLKMFVRGFEKVKHKIYAFLMYLGKRSNYFCPRLWQVSKQELFFSYKRSLSVHVLVLFLWLLQTMSNWALCMAQQHGNLAWKNLAFIYRGSDCIYDGILVHERVSIYWQLKRKENPLLLHIIRSHNCERLCRKHDVATSVFPRLALTTCFCIEFWLGY